MTSHRYTEAQLAFWRQKSAAALSRYAQVAVMREIGMTNLKIGEVLGRTEERARQLAVKPAERMAKGTLSEVEWREALDAEHSEIAVAKTRAELEELGRQRGYWDPALWAAHVMRARGREDGGETRGAGAGQHARGAD